MNEQILVFPAEILNSVDQLSGFSPDAQTYFDKIFNSGKLGFMDRQLAENDPNFKQVIPYQVIHSVSTDTYFNYIRGANGGEDRLKAKRSLGIGGHINDGDVGETDIQTFYNGALREWFEEVSYAKDIISDQLTGIIYDPSTAVGRVHVGFVTLIELPDENLKVVDDAIIKDCWLTLEELELSKRLFEPWSIFVIDHLTSVAATPSLSRENI